MKRIILILLAVFTVFAASAQKKIDFNIKSLKENVGVTTREDFAKIVEYSHTADDGREVYQGFNDYDKMMMAYYCIFDERGILKSVMFPTQYIDGYSLEMLMVNKIKPYKKDKYDYRNYPQRFFYKWDGREIIVDQELQRVYIFKKE